MSETYETPTTTIKNSDLIIDGWFHERGDLWPGQAMSLKIEEILYSGRSLYQDILVFKSLSHGNVLVLDGVIQVTEKDEFAYQEMITHLPMFSHPNPKNVLVIGGGDGGVLREVCKHPSVESVTICELDADVIKYSKLYLPSLAIGYSDPRVTVKVMDGIKFMSDMGPNKFDVIITDSSDPIGPAQCLFEAPFYRSMHTSLKPGGVICTQGECIWLHKELIKPLVNKCKEFCTTVEYANISIPTYPSGNIGFILCTKEKADGATVCSREVTFLKDLQYYNKEIHSASFILPNFAKRAIFGEDSV